MNMCQRKGEEWKKIGIRGGKRDVKHKTAGTKLCH